MYTVLIAEDELLVRMGIASSVPWSQMDMRVVAETADGEAALDAFHRFHPDIVITDIRMPRIDGLELMRRIRAEDPTCAMIVVTNVEHSSMLEEARRLKAVDFLLKATMKRDDITAAVLKACKSLPEGRGSAALPADNRVLWREYLTTEQMSADSFRERCAQTGSPFFQPYGFVLLHIQSSEHLSHRLYSSLVSLFSHRLGSIDSFLIVELDSIAIALARKPFDLQDMLRRLRELARYVRDNFGESLCFVVQSALPEPDALRKSVGAAMRCIYQPAFFDQPALALDADGAPFFPELLDSAHTLYLFALLSGQTNEYCKCADDISALSRALEDGWTAGKRLGEQILAVLHAASTQTGAHGLVDDIVRAVDRMCQDVRLSMHDGVLAAIDYMQSHISDELPIRQVSEIAGYHPVYFSNLFKRETGMSFSDFLTALRIQRAKELLKSTSLPLQEISCSCGFSDLSYFSYKFKRVVGMAPSQWRSQT